MVGDRAQTAGMILEHLDDGPSVVSVDTANRQASKDE
jgi:hypothetical protein